MAVIEHKNFTGTDLSNSLHLPDDSPQVFKRKGLYTPVVYLDTALYDPSSPYFTTTFDVMPVSQALSPVQIEKKLIDWHISALPKGVYLMIALDESSSVFESIDNRTNGNFTIRWSGFSTAFVYYDHAVRGGAQYVTEISCSFVLRTSDSGKIEFFNELNNSWVQSDFESTEITMLSVKRVAMFSAMPDAELRQFFESGCSLFPTCEVFTRTLDLQNFEFYPVRFNTELGFNKLYVDKTTYSLPFDEKKDWRFTVTDITTGKKYVLYYKSPFLKNFIKVLLKYGEQLLVTVEVKSGDTYVTPDSGLLIYSPVSLIDFSDNALNIIYALQKQDEYVGNDYTCCPLLPTPLKLLETSGITNLPKSSNGVSKIQNTYCGSLTLSEL